jgi:NADH-quinone oxidoreductase subunit E
MSIDVPVADSVVSVGPVSQTETSDLAYRLSEIEAVLERHHHKRTALIPVLQEIQNRYRYLPAHLLTYVASALNISPATVFGVATFYAQFSLEPKGKYVVRVCDGTACHVKDSQSVLNVIRKKVKLTGTMITTPDQLFTVETVACLGACGLAPVMVVNDRVHGQLTSDAAELIIDELLTRETAEGGAQNGN